MMSLVIAAFIMGGIGSVHCIGMCGPLALSLPVITHNPTSRFISTLLYNIGRVATYALLGAIFGVLGMSFALFGYQQWLSIALGLLILLFLVLPKQNFISKKSNVVMTFFGEIRNWLGDLFHRKNYRSVFFIGLLNGLLPCGLVYMAVAAAISTASVAKSSLFMAMFGLGTLPVMWSIAFFGSSINMSMRRNIKKLYPYIMLVMALLLIIRGLGLQIPYVSPGLDHGHDAAKVVGCGHD
jgi:hypothetical protein